MTFHSFLCTIVVFVKYQASRSGIKSLFAQSSLIMQRTLFSILAGSSIVAAWTELSHEPFMTKNIDAIVVPGTYTSHMHTFFGSDATTNVMPTSVDLQEGCYSGDNPNDLSVYCT